MDNIVTPEFLIENKFEYDEYYDLYFLETNRHYIEIEFLDCVNIFLRTFESNIKFNTLTISLHDDLSINKFQQILSIMDINFETKPINKNLLLKNGFEENLDLDYNYVYTLKNEYIHIYIDISDDEIYINCESDTDLGFEGTFISNMTISQLEMFLKLAGINFIFKT